MRGGGNTREIAKLKRKVSKLRSLNAMNLERMSQAYSLVEAMREQLGVSKARLGELLKGYLAYRITSFF